MATTTRLALQSRTRRPSRMKLSLRVCVSVTFEMVLQLLVAPCCRCLLANIDRFLILLGWRRSCIRVNPLMKWMGLLSWRTFESSRQTLLDSHLLLSPLRDRMRVGSTCAAISSAQRDLAVIHYSPEKGSCSRIDPNQIYLCDSGAQYKDGTTDTTRTVHFVGQTVVLLRGLIFRVFRRKRRSARLPGSCKVISPLTSLSFPKGLPATCWTHLLGRRCGRMDWVSIFEICSESRLTTRDFRHGTGHGVGSYLNVHEGPHGIGTRIAYNDVALASGMTVSNEPGFYKDGHFGIRIENIVLVKEVKTLHRFGDRDYLGFEHVTMVSHRLPIGAANNVRCLSKPR